MHVASLSLLLGDVARSPAMSALLSSTRIETAGVSEVVPSGIPQTLDELTNIEVQSYDLSVTAAASLNIPVIGSVGGGLNRRVVVLEHLAYKELIEGDVRLRYGYTVRFCVTVSRWDANFKLSLPFLAASAEVGSVSAQWRLQILGLAGPKIDAALLPPTELNVEKFVLAKQSQEKVIAAIRDPTTIFKAQLLLKIEPEQQRLRQYRIAVAQAYALSSLMRGRSLVEALRRLNADPAGDPLRTDSVKDLYRAFGLDDDNVRPSDPVRSQAREILEGVEADV
jgi:hypothetical protein